MKNSLSSMSRILIPVRVAAVVIVAFALFSARQSPAEQDLAAKSQLPIQNDGSTLVNGYQVPALPGWKRETTAKNGLIQSVKFNDTVEGTKIMMKFVLFPKAPGQPDTAQDLVASVKLADSISKKMGENRQTLLSQATRYRSYPAYLTQTLLHKGNTLVESQILRVADGTHTFWFFQSLSGQQISPAARAAASKAWQTMTNGLKNGDATK